VHFRYPRVRIADERVQTMQCVAIPSHNLIVLSCEAKLRVFKNDDGAELIHVFEMHALHDAAYVHIVRMFDDVLCSYDTLGNLLHGTRALESFLRYCIIP